MSSYGALARFYDELTLDVPYGSFADFYGLIFEKYGCEPHTVLDLACGTGTLTCLLASRGYEMIGVDASEEMLSLAQNKSYEGGYGTPPMFLCQSMEELDLYGTVDAAVCSLDGINYLPPESLGPVLDRLRLFVAPEGVVIFDVNTPERLASLDGEVFLDEREDVFCVWRAAFDEGVGALTYGMDIFSREAGALWRRESEEHVEYAHSRDFICGELRAHGFGEISVFGELRDEPPREGEGRVFFAARRL